MRKIALLAGALLLGLLPLAPAAAAPNPGTPAPHAPRPRPPVVEPQIPLCVTTTWRAKHTHRPKTRVGQICVATPDMWLPRSWPVLAVVDLGAGRYGLLVLRTR